MAQFVVLGSLGVVLTVAAIVWRCRPRNAGRLASASSAGDLFRRVSEKSLPAEGFEDWKLHFVRIAISALPPPRRACLGLEPQRQRLVRRAKATRVPACP